MKIRILGTAAAEGWPGLFCNCEICQKVRKLKGKDIRTRSSVLIDDTLMIDAGFDNFMHSLQEGVDFRKIKDVFITHSHADHFNKYDLYLIFHYDMSLYGNKEVIDEMMTLDVPEKYSGINLMCPYETVKTSDGHIVTSVKAEHSPEKVIDMNYIIQNNGKTVAYLTDSGLYKDEKTWEFLSKYKFDIVISECTSGWNTYEPFYHQTFQGVCDAKKRFVELGCINENTPYYITHFSHNNAGVMHEEMCRRCKPFGITVCYDGMDIVL